MTETRRYFATMDSPVGLLVLVGEGPDRETVRLTAVSFAGQGPADCEPAPEAFEDVRRQLEEYFGGGRTAFELDLAANGTPFQQRVWAAVDEIEAGTTRTYGQIAEQVGAPRDRIRAVAAAVGANPLLIVRPCHRVIGADGSLTGYAGGVERKQFLLAHEGALEPLLFA